jgi:hypothetical protein
MGPQLVMQAEVRTQCAAGLMSGVLQPSHALHTVYGAESFSSMCMHGAKAQACAAS